MAYWSKNGTTPLQSLSIGKSWQSSTLCAFCRLTQRGELQQRVNAEWQTLSPAGVAQFTQVKVGYCWWSATTPEIWCIGTVGGQSGVWRFNGTGFDNMSAGAMALHADAASSLTVGYGGVYVAGMPQTVPGSSRAIQYVYGWAPGTPDPRNGQWVIVGWGYAYLRDLCSGYIRSSGQMTPVLSVLLCSTQNGPGTLFQSQFQNWFWNPWQLISDQPMQHLDTIGEDKPVALDAAGKAYLWGPDQSGQSQGEVWNPLTSVPPVPGASVVTPTLSSITQQYSTVAYGIDANGQEWIYSG